MIGKYFKAVFQDGSTEFVSLDVIKARLRRQLDLARKGGDSTAEKLVERELKHLGRQSGLVGHAASRTAVSQQLDTIFAQAYESLYAKNPKRAGYRNLYSLAYKICQDEALKEDITPATARAWHQRNRRPATSRD